MPLLARILESARIQALLAGLIRITCIEMRIGADSAIDPKAIASAMEERFQGDLLDQCRIEIEVVEGTQVQLKSIEGVPFQARDAI